MQSWAEEFGLESQTYKCNNDNILRPKECEIKDIEVKALLKHNTVNNDQDEVDKTSTLEGDIGEPPKRDIKVVMEELRVPTSKCKRPAHLSG